MVISLPRDANRITMIGGTSSSDGVTPVAIYVDPITHRLKVDLPSSGGTVSTVSIVTANGISGSVANPTTTPAITLALGDITPSSVQVSGLTASQILSTDASKNLTSLAVATYPSLAELAFVKGVTSAIQTQLNTKGAGTVTAIGVTTANGVSGSSSGGATPNLTIALGAITPTTVVASGSISGSNLSGTNTGDQTISDATITTTDITTNNVSTSKHGFAPKAPNDATKFLDGTGAYSTPAGGEWTYLSKVTYAAASGAQSFTSLATHDNYKLVIRLYNTTNTDLSTSVTLNNVGGTGYSQTTDYFGSGGVTNVYNGTASFRIYSANGAQAIDLEAEMIISGKHRQGLKSASLSYISSGMTSINDRYMVAGGLTGDSNDLSRIDISIAGVGSGTVELWYKDAK